jgi:hypothetical protein
LHLTWPDCVDIRITEKASKADIERAIPTARAWAARLYKERVEGGRTGGDLRAELWRRNQRGESWGDLARAANRRIAGYLARIEESELNKGATRQFAVLADGFTRMDPVPARAVRSFIWDDLRHLGVGDDRATKIVNGLFESVQSGVDPIDEYYPVDRNMVRGVVGRWRAKHIEKKLSS